MTNAELMKEAADFMEENEGRLWNFIKARHPNSEVSKDVRDLKENLERLSLGQDLSGGL